MSKITPKNLQYNTTLPPFLARLQGQKGGRNEFQAARPQKPNSISPEDDDPVYFDEETGDSLTKKEWEEKEKAEDEAGEKVAAETQAKEGTEKATVAVIGASRKKKTGKVVGVEQEDVKGTGSKRKADGNGEKEKGKVSKKGKKVKLSFGDDED